MAETHLSKETHERLQLELEDLSTRGRVEIANQIEAARALGDLSENADYHAAKDSQGKMEARIRQLQAMLASAVVVDHTLDLTNAGVVRAGAVVELRYDGEEETERYLVGSIEERPVDVTVLSPASPLGRALLGHAPGERIEYEAPNGRLAVEIVAID